MLWILWVSILAVPSASAAVAITGGKREVAVDPASTSLQVQGHADNPDQKAKVAATDPHTLEQALAMSNHIAEGHPALVRSEQSGTRRLAPALSRSEKKRVFPHVSASLPDVKQDLFRRISPVDGGELKAIVGEAEGEMGIGNDASAASDAPAHGVAGGRRRVQCWHMCNTNHAPDDYNGCTYGNEKREAFKALIEEVRNTRCQGIDTVNADAEDACTPEHGCTGQDDSIDSDIGACVPINELDNTVCQELVGKDIVQGVTDATRSDKDAKGAARPAAQGLLFPTLLAAVGAVAAS